MQRTWCREPLSLEDVTKMAAACSTHNLRPCREQRFILMTGYGARNSCAARHHIISTLRGERTIKESWPSTSALP